MAYQLVADVLDHAPRELTPAESLLLVVLAEWARSPVDRTWAGEQREIARRMRVEPETVSKVLRRLRDRGLEVRVPLAHRDRHGRPVYAVPGRATTFRLPEFTPPPDCSCGTCKAGPSSGLDTARPDPRPAKARPSSGQTGPSSGPLRSRTSVEGGTTDATTRPRNPTESRAPHELEAAPRPLSPDSRCGLPGCPAPGPCGPCRDARRRADAERMATNRSPADRSPAAVPFRPDSTAAPASDTVRRARLAEIDRTLAATRKRRTAAQLTEAS